jgi:hypothetical protein
MAAVFEIERVRPTLAAVTQYCDTFAYEARAVDICFRIHLHFESLKFLAQKKPHDPVGMRGWRFRCSKFLLATRNFSRGVPPASAMQKMRVS